MKTMLPLQNGKPKKNSLSVSCQEAETKTNPCMELDIEEQPSTYQHLIFLQQAACEKQDLVEMGA